MNKTTELTLSSQNLTAFKKAMKTAYYRIFYKNGLITDKQLETLL